MLAKVETLTKRWLLLCFGECFFGLFFRHVLCNKVRSQQKICANKYLPELVY